MAAACGIEDSTIQTSGRWESSAYLRYVRIPRETLASISKSLLSDLRGTCELSVIEVLWLYFTCSFVIHLVSDMI